MRGPIKVALRKVSASEALIDLTGPSGESESHRFELPWRDQASWEAVFLSLELHMEDLETWPTKADVLEKARELGLFLDDRPSNDRFMTIGRILYDTVFGSEGIRQLLARLLHMKHEMSVLEFHIPDEGTMLQAYPWELLHDGKRFLFDGIQVSLVRHVDFEEGIPEFELPDVLKVLYVAPRPDMSSYDGFASLPIIERLHLQALNSDYPDHLALDSLASHTLSALQKYLMRHQNHVYVVHIDTHGDFGWLCLCKRLNPSGVKQCSQCGNVQSADQRNRGYLAFESEGKTIEWVSGEELGKLLYGRGIQAVVLSACRSGMVGGATTFNSIAGALVKNHIPAVVATQFSIGTKQAEKFVQFFYSALVYGRPLTQAVAEARMALAEDSYRPVLYMRTDPNNYEGKVFDRQSQIDRLEKLTLTSREKWIKLLGFERDPFISIDGGEDDNLQHYFYFNMKHFNEVLDASRPGTVLVFGPPGSGKSSMRNVIAQLCPTDNILPLIYQHFGPLLDKKHQQVTVEDHVEQILKMALGTLADLVDKGEISVSATPSVRNNVILNELWRYIVKYVDDPLQNQTLNALKPHNEIAGELPPDAWTLLGRFCRYVAELLGKHHVYILVDFDDSIASNDNLAWGVLVSLLSSRSLLDLSKDKVVFKFFLSQKFRHQARQIPWIDQEWDKRCYDLEWTDEELRKLLGERLKGSSDGRRESLGVLSDVSDLDDRVIELSIRSPRKMIVLCNKLFSEHCRSWSPNNKENLFITVQEVSRVLTTPKEVYAKSPQEQQLEQWIDQGESEKVEFKSTLRYNRKASRPDKEMEREVVRTICAFMNAEGGTLIIGVDDDGTVIGLDDDFSTLGRRKNKDGFEQAFANITENHFSPKLFPDNYKAYFIEYLDKFVYVVEVKRSKKPVYCLFEGATEFYVRKQSTSRKLDIKDALDYCIEHFNQ